MTDYHTHILPKMDDGSGSVEESLSLLREEARQGIDTVVATPHFYASQNSPGHFLKRRYQAFQRLQPALDRTCPGIILGAEVQFFPGISDCADVSLLTIGQTKLLLLEMPFSRWDSQMLHEVFYIQERLGLQVVLAHIDRYYADQPRSVWQELHAQSVLMQLNASAFDGFLRRRQFMPMLENGMVHMLGSDCHNMSSRKPNWKTVPEQAPALAMENLKSALTASGSSGSPVR